MGSATAWRFRDDFGPADTKESARKTQDVAKKDLRDLSDFPDLLERVEREDLRRVFGAVTQWLRTQSGSADGHTDWSAIAAVVVGAISHYWIILDVLGHHPDGVVEDRYVAAIVVLLSALFESC
jgi:hypothetical protein